jgi:predicted lipoprotein with Yx(FWY)xxD motif
VKNSFVLAVAGTSLAALALAGCGSSDSGGAGGGSAPTAGSDIGTAKSSFGQIVVDGKGMTAYFYDKDVASSGKSACTGTCTSEWSAVTSSSAKPKVDGVTGTVATITGTDGGKQITINGRPIYTFADDSSAGDTNGQGDDGEWHVISPAGKEITKKAASASSGGY